MRFSEIAEGIVAVRSVPNLPPKLYHGTDMLAAAMILASDRMTESVDDGPHGVSMTSTPAMAWSFADRSSYIWYINHWSHPDRKHRPEPPLHGVVFEFDAPALLQDYQIVRYDDEDNDDELEERVLTSSGIAPLTKYLRCFYARSADIDFFHAYVTGDEFWQAADFVEPAALPDQILRLKTHPLRREP